MGTVEEKNSTLHQKSGLFSLIANERITNMKQTEFDYKPNILV